VGDKKLNIAVVLSSDLESGGGFQYEFMVLKILKDYHTNEEFDFNYYTINNRVKENYSGLNIKIKELKENLIQKAHRFCLTNYYLFSFFSKLGFHTSFLEKAFKKDKIELVYFLSPSIVSLGLNNIPYIFTLWDLGHLDLVEFPEVSYNRQFELRELINQRSLKKAFKVIVDLEYGKSKVADKYQVDEKRIETLKFLPNIKTLQNQNDIDIKKKYNLKNDYIFYPAQFWPHKNHIYILEAIKILKENKKIEVDVVFSGSDKGNLQYILEKSEEYKIKDLIHYVGFVEEKEMPSLYKQSISLVMPTYLGPTNIPPLEAFFYKTPLCYSDLDSFREQVGEAAFYMDLTDPNSLVDHILTIINNDKTVIQKIKSGLQVLDSWKEEDFYLKIIEILKEFKFLREKWN
jgi:glycosyltransferase involved in cell wall biosynthesis